MVVLRKYRIVELLVVLAFVAVIILVQKEPQSSVSESKSPSQANSAPSPAPTTEPRLNIQGYYLGDKSPADANSHGVRWETNEKGQLSVIRGRELHRGDQLLFQAGATHDQVKAAIGKGNAFAHGGRAWGYWRIKEGQEKNPGLLIKFDESGVQEVVLNEDWVPLSTELALMTINGSSKPVDGSDGYKDLREWAEQGKGKR